MKDFQDPSPAGRMRLAATAADSIKPSERTNHVPMSGKIAGSLMLAEVALLPIAVAVFVFDREISNFMYGLGFSPARLTPLFNLENRYNFFLTHMTSADAHLFDFHVFEMVAWLVVFVASARLVTIVLLLNYFDGRLNIRALIPCSGLVFFLGWLLIGPVGVWLSMDTILGAGAGIVRSFMAYSPRAYLCAQAVILCAASAFLIEGLWIMLQVSLAVWRRGSSTKPIIS